jgi:NADPH:quinone reductase
MNTAATNSLQLRSLITAEGRLQLSLLPVHEPAPGPDEVQILVQATPINPSDIGLLFGAADMRSAELTAQGFDAVLGAPVPAAAMKAMAPRVGQSLPVGNEGAGLVVATGSSPEARALLGTTVAALGGAMYSTLRTVKVASCLPLPAGTTPAAGASCFVNPLTALGMVETMRHEGHTALVHTASASNLGQMLNRICLKDGVSLVHIVRKPEQVALLRGQGAAFVCDSSSPDFQGELTEALVATGATLAFDATGGGKLAGQILSAMEAALNRKAAVYSRYGSPTHKQVYLYGGLDTAPTEITRNFGMAWGIGGWLVFPYLQKLGPAKLQELRARVVAELHTTFASHYAAEISLPQMLQPDVVARYNQRATGEKFLLNPSA